MYLTKKRSTAAMRRSLTLCILFILLSLTASGMAPGVQPSQTSAAARLAPVSCANTALASTAGFTLPLCTTGSLTQRNEAIRRAIIVVEPAETNMGGSVPGTVSFAGYEQETIVIAPTFREVPSEPNVLYWGGDWRFGNVSVNGPQVSSFQIVDDLVDQLANPSIFPNLQYLVVTGFSAGGQFANRYAAFSPKQQQIEQQTSYRIQFRYVVGSPSIYVYMDGNRWDAASQQFGPVADPFCSGNWYPYGLDRTGFDGAYVDNVTNEQVRAQYALRNVYYLVGADDNVRDPSLVTSCEADNQGQNRLERAQLYQRHIQFFYGASAPLHALVVVPGIGHSDAVYASDLGRPTLFDNWPASPNHRILGRVLDEAGRPAAGVSVSAGGGLTAVTDSSGSYIFQNLAAGSYTITPSGPAGSSFTPATRSATVPQSVGEQNFTMTVPRIEPMFWAPTDPLILRSGSALFIEAANFPPNSTATILISGQSIGTAPINGSGSAQIELRPNTPTAPGAYLLTLRSGSSSASLVYWLNETEGSLITPSGSPPIAIPAGAPLAKQIFLPLVRH